MGRMACCTIDCCLYLLNTFESLLFARHCARPSLLSTKQDKVPLLMEVIVFWGRQTINLSLSLYKLSKVL